MSRGSVMRRHVMGILALLTMLAQQLHEETSGNLMTSSAARGR